MKNNKSLIFISIFLLLITIGMTTATLCYQESANVSNQTGIDGNCGLQYNGSYALMVKIPTDNSNSFNKFAINYTVPQIGLSNVILQINKGNNYYNYTIQQSCINDKIEIIFTGWMYSGSPNTKPIVCSNAGDGYCSFIECRNSTGWEYINTSLQFSSSGQGYTPTTNETYLFYPFDGNWSTYLCGTYGIWQYPDCSGSAEMGKLKEEGIYWDVCINNWVLNSTSCNGIIQNYTSLYYDTGNCNNTYNLPVDNGTLINCCIENFTATTISCDGIMNQTIINYTDMNSCNTTFTRPPNYGNVTACCVEQFIQNDTACNLYNYTIQYYDNRSCGTYFTLPLDNNLTVDCLCPSNWVQDVTPCINNINLVTYHDTTNCGNLTVIPPPINNGTYQNCVIQQQMNWNDDIIILAVLFLFILVCTICAIAVHEAFFGIDALLILSMLYVFWHYNYPQILWYVTPFIALAFLIMWVALWKVRRGK